MIRDYPQFFNWRFEADPSGKKPAKVPYNFRADHRIDPHDARNWMTYSQAAATGHPIGFAITAKDPFFFIDLDNCRVGQGWSHEAVEIFQRFPGAAVELSQSGNGLHIMGVCNKAALADRRNKWDGWKEFYIKERFIAFGSAWGWQGSFQLDFTAALMAFVPVRETPADVMTQRVGPVIEYTGPADDDELIGKALAARGSIAGAFGARASFKDLWTADPSMLVQYFPSPSGDTWDRSSADAALMVHLAFWTGKDAARMDRLFRRSALMRDKYGMRADYRNSTIAGAIAKCAKVYDVVKSTPEQPTVESHAPGEILSVSEQLEYFKGCVYVRDAHRVMIPTGELIPPAQFKAFYGGKRFIMSGDGGGTTTNAFEAFTENRVVTFPKVHSTCFRPLATPGAIIEGKVNVYTPLTIEARDGDAGPFFDFVTRLLPNERDRMILLTYLAALKQYPGVKFQWAVVLQGVEGNGKSAISRIMEYAIGQRYTHTPAAEDLTNQFNAYLENKLLISVEEIHLQGKRELLDTLKPLITNDRIEVQAKGVDKRMIDNFANWLMMTNHRDAIVKTKNDRRYAIFFTAQQTSTDIIASGMGGDYFRRFYEWLRADGFKIVTRFLERMPLIEEFNPAGSCQRAPDTSTTDLAIHASMGRAEQEIFEAVDSDRQGFKNGWISTYAVELLLKESNIRMARQKIGDMLEACGYKSIGRATKNIIFEGDKRPVLYVEAKKWAGNLTVDDYQIAQGYMKPDGKVLPFRLG